MEVWPLWHANYWFSGAVKALTAMASVPTAILLVDLVPEAIRLPSPEALRDEIAECKRAQEAVIEAENELERRVQERTADLTNASEKLIAEIEQRKLAEDSLRRSEERFRLLIEDVEEYAIFSLDPSGHVTSWIAGAEHIMGYLRAGIYEKVPETRSWMFSAGCAPALGKRAGITRIAVWTRELARYYFHHGPC